ncbi:hypothetical protein BDP55DRAFT_768359 [Colletotrichum godetiae]|uniref:PHD-type domain-containing protein n=1 Tax=Colletotrichum godetiae TaxID=1209918 RepID=A0AAJ0AM06_9PEZI|nr:uncharacterized protein BDP55DRAFT_768359 [Colletotrichum godetiae]KAK1675695.1 hypothetical protein BDP55DRAFT_768359 [Colletotrichum godetiae]
MDNDGSREPPRKRLRSAQPTRRGRSRVARGGGSLNGNTPREGSDEADNRSTEQQVQAPDSSFDPRSLSIPAALERYKAWKEAGAQHDEFCFICRQTNGLTYCVTCKRSYHESCRPQESTHSVVKGNSCFFCEVCVHRNWHKDPPFLMPEMRPLAASSSSPTHAETVNALGSTPSTKGKARQDVPDSHQLRQDQEASGTEASRATPSTAARKTRTIKASHSAAREATIAGPSSSNTRIESITLPAAAPSRDEPRSGSSTVGRAPAARKSRYITLPTDVDAALRLLYAELETAHELRHKVGDVEGQVAQMQRELHLRNSELAVARRAADVSRVSATEMEQLRERVSLGETAIAEAVELRSENRMLRAELETSREKLTESNRALEEWKRKLSALMS